MKKISKDTQQKLLSCVEKLAESVQPLDDPDQAIIKVAKEQQLRPGEINVVVQAYNTGRTNRQRESEEDLFSKAASFRLANASNILESLFPENVKTAAEQFLSTAVDPAYDFAPNLSGKELSEKQASQKDIDWRNIFGVGEATPTEKTAAQTSREIVIETHRKKVAYEDARSTVNTAYQKLDAALDDLADYFARPEALPLPVVKEASSWAFGTSGVRVVDDVMESYPNLMQLSHHKYPNTAIKAADINCKSEPFGRIATVLDLIGDYAEKQATLENTEPPAIPEYREFKEASEDLPMSVEEYGDTQLGEPSEQPAEKAAMLGAITNSFGYRAINKGMDAIGIPGNNTPSPTDTAAPNPEELQQETNREQDHQQHLSYIRNQANLYQMLSEDPVISQQDPDEVISKYNEITSMYPSIAQQPMLLRNFLRKYIQQGDVDMFEQDQVGKILQNTAN